MFSRLELRSRVRAICSAACVAVVLVAMILVGCDSSGTANAPVPADATFDATSSNVSLDRELCPFSSPIFGPDGNIIGCTEIYTPGPIDAWDATVAEYSEVRATALIVTPASVVAQSIDRLGEDATLNAVVEVAAQSEAGLRGLVSPETPPEILADLVREGDVLALSVPQGIDGPKSYKEIPADLALEWTANAQVAQFFGARNDAVPYDGLDGFFEANSVPTQTFTLEAEEGGQVESPRGTALTFPPNAFTLGDTPVSGPVTVELRETFTASDFVTTNVFTQTSEGQALESGGSFFVGARQDGRALQLAQPVQLSTPVQTRTPPQGMMLFNAANNGSSTVTWNPNPIADVPESDGVFFTTISDNFGWKNIDRFPDATPAAITVAPIGNLAGPNDTIVAFIADNVTVAIRIPPGSTPGEFVNAAMPEGEPGTIVVIGTDDGSVWFGQQDVVIADGARYDIITEPTPEQEVLDVLDSL